VDLYQEIESKIYVLAEPKHEPEQTVSGAAYVFSYHITILNNSAYTVQLLRRHWFITDGIFGEREVQGDGVIGQTPRLKPGEKFEYESWCPVSSDFGSMHGYFTFNEFVSKTEFDVAIPAMVLLPKFVLN
jgi:ApaG protein